VTTAEEAQAHAHLDSPEIQALIIADEVPKGGRSESVFRVMYACGEAGWSNHDILTLARELGERWGCLPASNVFNQWTRLLAMLRRVRRAYPNPAQGDAR
jgi:hypothetical protein